MKPSARYADSRQQAATVNGCHSKSILFLLKVSFCFAASVADRWRESDVSSSSASKLQKRLVSQLMLTYSMSTSSFLDVMLPCLAARCQQALW